MDIARIQTGSISGIEQIKAPDFFKIKMADAHSIELLRQKTQHPLDLVKLDLTPNHRVISDLFKNVSGSITMRFIQEYLGSWEARRREIDLSREKDMQKRIVNRQEIETVQRIDADERFLREIKNIMESTKISLDQTRVFAKLRAYSKEG